MSRRDLDKILEDVNREYGGDLGDYLGAGWRDIIRPHLQSAWNFGYTTGMKDAAVVAGEAVRLASGEVSDVD